MSPVPEAVLPLRIAIVTYESLQSKLIVRALLDAFPGAVAGIVVSHTAIPGRSVVRSLWFALRRTGLWFVLRKGTEIWVSRLAAWGGRGAGATTLPSLPAMAAGARVPLVGVDDVNGAAAQAAFTSWQPDLLVSVNCNQRLTLPTLGRARRGAVNVHGALLPRYRGLFPYFWVLADGETETGVTVHWMDEHFDTGAVIVQERIPIDENDTVFSLSVQGAHVGAEILPRAIRMIADGSAPAVAQDDGQSSYRSWPLSADVRRLRQRGRRYGSFAEMWRAFRA